MFTFPVGFFQNTVVAPFNYLLDGLTGVVSARSVRKMKSTYNGNILQVIKATGATQNIGINNNEIDNATLLNFAGNDNVYVKSLYDQVSTFNASQTTTASQPTIVNNGVINKSGGKTTINYINQNLISSLPLSDYPITIIAVVSITSSTNGAFIKIGNDTSGIGISVGNSTADNVGSNVIGFKEGVVWVPSTSSLPFTKMAILEVSVDAAGNMRIFLNGDMLTSSNATQYPPSGSYYIGGYANNTGGSHPRYPNSSISEDFVLNRILTPDERSILVANQKAYYNI